MNKFSYYITTHSIPSNKYYYSCHNSHSAYRTYPNNILYVVGVSSQLVLISISFYIL